MSSQSLERTLPHNIDDEKSVLGAILVNNVLVVAPSQLSRAPEQRQADHKQQLSDLRECGVGSRIAVGSNTAQPVARFCGQIDDDNLHVLLTLRPEIALNSQRSKNRSWNARTCLHPTTANRGAPAARPQEVFYYDFSSATLRNLQ
jgi:replicative DNA helicase